MPNTNVLSVNEVREEGVCFVVLTGRIDSTNADDVMQRLKTLITAREKSVVVDLSQVVYLTSLGFRAFVVAAREAERNDSTFALCGVGGHIRDLFEIAGMLEVFTIHPSRQEAVARGAAGG